MVYFDGSEDVDRRRFGYYTSNFHAVAMSKFTKRPLIHMGGGFTHNLWHSFTRDATVDQYPGTYLAYINAGGTIRDWPTCKDHIDRSVRRVLDCHDDMTPGELGWFGIGPKSGNYDGLQFDEIEYLMCKSLALDAPISLQTSFSRMESHPLTAEILEIVRRYEQLRLSDTVPEATLARLRQQGTDFLMLPDPMARTETGRPQFAEVQELPRVAGTHDVRSFAGSHGDGGVATVWHYLGRDGRLLFDTADVAAYDVRGEPVVLEASNGLTAVLLGPRRTTLHFAGLPADAVAKLLARARLELRKPDVFWIRAGDFSDRVGAMVRGSEVQVEEPDALGDVVLSSGPIDRSGKTPSYCEYRVEIPRKGKWTVWARVRYPRGGDMSLGIVRPGEEVTLTGPQVIGNCGVNQSQWHWTGRGGGVTTVPPGSPVVFALEPGPFVFRIYPREGGGTAATNPRLDCLAVCEEAGYVPTDADARAGLGTPKAPPQGGTFKNGR
jgi:hypothetical protein